MISASAEYEICKIILDIILLYVVKSPQINDYIA